MSRDAFPSTRQTWIDHQLASRPGGREALNRHIMDVYARPLEVYLSGIPYLRGADHADLVRGFFADRLERDDFFDRWQASGRRLRHWLMKGLWFHLKEQYRRDIAHTAAPLSDDDAMQAERVRDADRAYLVGLVDRACARAGDECAEHGLEDHWRVFLRRDRDGESYRVIATELGIDERRAAVMARTARGRFERALCELLVKDGIPESEVGAEVRTMLEELSQ